MSCHDKCKIWRKPIPDNVEHVFSANTSDEKEKRQIAMMRTAAAATDVEADRGGGIGERILQLKASIFVTT